MCGICGIIKKNDQKVYDKQISNMCQSMVHRGPDDEGVFVFESFGIGMRRLKIIDLETGNQPIHNEDKTKWIVFNGEIYNFQALRNDMLAMGHTFYTKSDTEVVIHLYEQYGNDCVKYLNGMFCFAILDIREKSVFIARDRLGIKQLYYYEDENFFLFGSEIKVILQIIGRNRPIDHTSLDDYFSFLYVPVHKTIFSDIMKLPAASYIDIKKNVSKMKTYWELKYNQTTLSTKEAIDITEEKIRQAVKYQMISDVPLGAFLSGGVDSSVIVAMMSELTSQPIETFSIVWDKQSKSFDEREYSQMVSKLYKTNHHEFLVEPNIEEVLDSIVESFDEPFADASAIPNYYLAKETRKFVTVALSGLGGDEIAAGYERYLGMKVGQWYTKVPQFLRSSVISKLVNKLPDSKKGSQYSERLKKFVNSADYEFLKRYFNIITTFEDHEKKALYSPVMQGHINNEFNSIKHFEKYLKENETADFLNRQLYIDQKTYLVDDLLVLSDRMSMAHSLELRVPFLDHTLVEHFAQLNSSLKLNFLTKKFILKKIAEKYLPKKLIYRKKKGFSVPLVLWFRNDLKKYLVHLLNEKSINKAGLLNYREIQIILNQHLKGERNNDEKIWSIVIFLLWYDKYIEKIY